MGVWGGGHAHIHTRARAREPRRTKHRRPERLPVVFRHTDEGFHGYMKVCRWTSTPWRESGRQAERARGARLTGRDWFFSTPQRSSHPCTVTPSSLGLADVQRWHAAPPRTRRGAPHLHPPHIQVRWTLARRQICRGKRKGPAKPLVFGPRRSRDPEEMMKKRKLLDALILKSNPFKHTTGIKDH